jgi:hypothetical protein
VALQLGPERLQPRFQVGADQRERRRGLQGEEPAAGTASLAPSVYSKIRSPSANRSASGSGRGPSPSGGGGSGGPNSMARPARTSSGAGWPQLTTMALPSPRTWTSTAVTKSSGPIARVTLRSNAAVTWARSGWSWAASRKLPSTTPANRTASRPLPRTSPTKSRTPCGVSSAS